MSRRARRGWRMRRLTPWTSERMARRDKDNIAFEPRRLSPVPEPPGESHEGSCSPPPDSERCQSSSTPLCPDFSRIVSTAVIAKPSQEQHETDGHGNATSAKSRASRRPNKHKWTGPGVGATDPEEEHGRRLRHREAARRLGEQAAVGHAVSPSQGPTPYAGNVVAERREEVVGKTNKWPAVGAKSCVTWAVVRRDCRDLENDRVCNTGSMHLQENRVG
ncbi:hypothetical protein BJ546DRAFT_952495 [Cryomyces antarcticus]